MARDATPKGLDAYSADEAKLIEQMRVSGAGDPPGAADSEIDNDTTPPPVQKPAPRAEPQQIDNDPSSGADELDLYDDNDGRSGEGEGSGQRSQTVPHKQFHAANERRKAAEAALADERSKAAAEKARLEERVNMVIAAAQAATAPPPVAPAVEEALPDVNTDPVGHFKMAYERTQKEVAELKGMFNGSQERQQQVVQVQALQNWGAQQERAFMAKEPTYNDAMNHLRASRAAELSAIGITDPNQQNQILGQDIQAIAVKARQDGADFAERLYKLAETRGFQKPAAAASPASSSPSIEIPGLDPGAAAARAQAGRDNALTIGSAGTAPGTKLSVDKIANMSEKQFESLLNNLKGDPAAIRNLMGN